MHEAWEATREHFLSLKEEPSEDEEVATMVVFLCSELCSFVVGATVPVDGGTDFF